MNKAQLIGFLRHMASVAGGVLIANPDPRIMAAGALLSALATGHSYAVKRDPKSPIGTNVAPLLVLACVLAGVGLGTVGCKTASGAPDTARTELVAYTSVKTAAVVVLQRDPGAADELQRIAAGVDTVFAKGSLDAGQLAAFLDSIKVRPEHRLIVASALSDAYSIYTATTGKPLVDVADPQAAAILRGVRRAVTDALALQKALAPSPAL